MFQISVRSRNYRIHPTRPHIRLHTEEPPPTPPSPPTLWGVFAWVYSLLAGVLTRAGVRISGREYSQSPSSVWILRVLHRVSRPHRERCRHARSGDTGVGLKEQEVTECDIRDSYSSETGCGFGSLTLCARTIHHHMNTHTPFFWRL